MSRDDVVEVAARRPGRPNRKQDVVDELTKKPAMPGQIAKRAKLGRTTVFNWLAEMSGHADPSQREAHIIKWQFSKHGGNLMATYAIGPGEHAKCELVPFTEAEKSERFRKKRRKEQAWDEKKRAAALQLIDQTAQHRDPMIEALFGPANRATIGTKEAS